MVQRNVRRPNLKFGNYSVAEKPREKGDLFAEWLRRLIEVEIEIRSVLSSKGKVHQQVNGQIQSFARHKIIKLAKKISNKLLHLTDTHHHIF
ncbi:MAG: hypothetical protein LBT09_05750 [Planctomycetaceae bacterium]|nr:hypothetical protein [Planctomycetaceae bacterium]